MADPRVVIGLDVGGTKVAGRAFRADAPTESLAELLQPTPHGTAALLTTIGDVGTALLDDPAVRAAGEVGAVGVGMPGMVTTDGILRYGPNLPGIVDLDVRGEVSDRLGLPVTVDNDANCAAWCEAVLGAAAGARAALLITLGTGIGGGIVLDGELFRGSYGFAGEPGHMVVDPDGPPCPCGRRGCWERYGSGTGLGRLGREAAAAGRLASVLAGVGGEVDAIQGEHVSEAALAGDAEAVTVLREAAWWVGLGIANLVNVLDVEVVVIGGGMASAGSLLVDAVDEAFQQLVFGADHRPKVRIVPARFGPESGAIGAGLLAAVRNPAGDPTGSG